MGTLTDALREQVRNSDGLPPSARLVWVWLLLHREKDGCAGLSRARVCRELGLSKNTVDKAFMLLRGRMLVKWVGAKGCPKYQLFDRKDMFGGDSVAVRSGYEMFRRKRGKEPDWERVDGGDVPVDPDWGSGYE